MIKEGGLLNVHCRIRSCPYPGTNIWSIQVVIASRISRKRVIRPRDSSSPAEGSGKPAWIVSRTPGKNGQVWCSQSQTVTTISIPREKNSSTSFDRCGYIDPDLIHHRNSKRVHTPGLASCAGGIEEIAVPCPEIPLSYLGTDGVMYADKQHTGFSQRTSFAGIFSFRIILCWYLCRHPYLPRSSSRKSGQPGNCSVSQALISSRRVRYSARSASRSPMRSDGLVK